MYICCSDSKVRAGLKGTIINFAVQMVVRAGAFGTLIHILLFRWLWLEQDL